MRIDLSRPDFLAVSAFGVSLVAIGGRAAEPAYKTTLHKAVILGADRMNEEMFKKLKDAGIEGFEARTVAVDKAKRARESAEKFGLRIHSVIGGGSVAGLRAAQAYGADVVLAPVGVRQADAAVDAAVHDGRFGTHIPRDRLAAKRGNAFGLSVGPSDAEPLDQGLAAFRTDHVDQDLGAVTAGLHGARRRHVR